MYGTFLFKQVKRMRRINYLKGDATSPVKCLGEGEWRVIIHVCNNIRKWGKGFVLSLSKKWPEPEQTYRKMEQVLGSICICVVEEDICVVNMIAQDGIVSNTHSRAETVYSKNGVPPIRYDALEESLKLVANSFSNYVEKTSFHMPRIGCGLAKGKWEIVENLITKYLVNRGYLVCVYDLK